MMMSCCEMAVVGITVAVGVPDVVVIGDTEVGAMAMGRILAMTLDAAD